MTTIRVISNFLLSIVFLSSCENLGKENIRYRKENKELEVQNINLSRKNKSLNVQNAELDRKLQEKKIYLGGKKPIYLIILRIEYVSFTLDKKKYIKNSLESFEITLETSKEFYNSINIGDQLDRGFNPGSFWIEGDFDKINIIVKSKKMIS